MSETPAAKTVDVLITSTRDSFWAEAQTILKGYYPYKLHFVKSADEVMNAEAGFAPLLALVDAGGGTAHASEWVQSVKMTYSDCPLIVLYGPEDHLDFTVVKKNGADYIMHLNYDREFVSDMILKLAPVELRGTDIPLSAMLPIDLKDLDIGEEINFDVLIHLPSNHKTFRIRKAGGTVDDRLLEKSDETHQRLYIKKTHIRPFFEYARTVLSQRNVANPVPLTEKIYRSKQLIYEIISEFLNSATADFQSGKAIFERCRLIIGELDLTREKTAAERSEEIFRFTGHYRSTYQDAINLAVYASNFAGLLDFKPAQVESAALAGILHNVGLSQMPVSSYGKAVSEFSAEDMAEYRRYPDRSVILIKAKKVPLPQEVSTAIDQHQELGDGTGFPKQLPADKIENLAKVLRLAMRFMELTSFDGVTPGMTPKAALLRIKEEALAGKPYADLTLAAQLHKKLI
jgi:HD-GYP domain-containing protein (c-di-GMP phosphodiesterase class II)